MRYSGSRNDLCAFQFKWLNPEVLKQSDALTKQHWHEVDVYCVKQSSFEALLCDTGRSDGNILVPGSLLCLMNLTFNAIADKDKRRSMLAPFLWNVMGKHNSW